MLKGSLLDPGYWKQQYFLAATLKKLLPTKPQVCALQLVPGDARHIGYLCPDKDAQGARLDRFIVLGKVGADLQDTLQKQGEVFKVAVEFRPWSPGAEAPGLRDSVDVALVAAGTTSGLASALTAGLGEARRALRSDGRLLLVVNEEDERALGDRLEVILEAQDLRDLSELEDITLEEGQGAAGQVLRRAGLRLVRVLRDECGLAVGICSRSEEEKVPGARRLRRQAAAAAAAQKQQQLQRSGPSPSKGAPPRPKR